MEIIRKLIHLSSLWLPIAALFLPHSEFAVIILGCTLTIVLFDVIRISNSSISKLLNKLLKAIKLNHIFRDHEKKALTGASFMFISASITFFIFPKEVFVLSMFLVTISDASAAVIGTYFGKKKIFHDRTLEGSAAFFISGVLIILFAHGIIDFKLWPALFACWMTTLSELMCKNYKLDDNLVIPLAFGSFYWLSSEILI